MVFDYLKQVVNSKLQYWFYGISIEILAENLKSLSGVWLTNIFLSMVFDYLKQVVNSILQYWFYGTSIDIFAEN